MPIDSRKEKERGERVFGCPATALTYFKFREPTGIAPKCVK